MNGLRTAMLMFLTSASVAIRAAAQQQAPASTEVLTSGDWVGQFVGVDSMTYVHARFSSSASGLRGTVDLPQSNSWGIELIKITPGSRSLSFAFVTRGDTMRFEGEAAKDSIDGVLRSGASQTRLHLMHRMAYDSAVVRRLTGNYRIAADRVISMGPMDEASGWLSFFDSKTRRGGILYGLSDSVFFTGPTFSIDYPIAIRAAVHPDLHGGVKSITWTERGLPPRVATRLDDVRSEDITFHNGSVRLEGMVTIPKAPGRHPAVILIHGCCGTVPTRDFGYWSSFLAGHGVAVLAYDKRGGGASTGNANTATYEEVADDVVAAFTYLQTRPDIDPSRIGFYGMSNGGYIAPLAAARSRSRVAFIAVRSGSARRVGDNIAYEVGNDLRSLGFAEDDIARAVAVRQRVTDFIIAHPVISVAAWDSLRAEVSAVSKERWYPWSRVGWVPLVSTDSGGVAYLNTLRSDWQYDPIPYWRRVRAPVYIMLGALDRSVPTAESTSLFRKALSDAGVVDARIRVFDTGNHGLLESRTGYDREVKALAYYVPGFQDELILWIRKQVGLGRDRSSRIDEPSNRLRSVVRSRSHHRAPRPRWISSTRRVLVKTHTSAKVKRIIRGIDTRYSVSFAEFEVPRSLLDQVRDQRRLVDAQPG